MALREIAHPVSRPMSVVPGTMYRTIGVKWWGEGAYERPPIDGSRTAAKTLSLVRANDLIINKIWVRHGSTAIASSAVDGCVASGEFPTFELDRKKVEPSWLHWLTRTREFWAACDILSRGTSGKNRIRPEQFLTIEVPLPPLAEQQRVVARIEAVAGKIEEARGLRRAAIQEVEALHGATAAALMRPSSSMSMEAMPIESLADVRGGIQKGPHRSPGANPVRYLTVAHVQRNRISVADPRFFEVTPAELDRWRLLTGDVLVIEGNGSVDQIGRTALFRGEIEDCVHQNHVIRVRPHQDRVIPKYLNAFLNSPAGQDEMQARSRSTSGLHTLSVGRIKELRIPLPSLALQDGIVARLDHIEVWVARLREQQLAAEAEITALLPAVLDRAFRGEL